MADTVPERAPTGQVRDGITGERRWRVAEVGSRAREARGPHLLRRSHPCEALHARACVWMVTCEAASHGPDDPLTNPHVAWLASRGRVGLVQKSRHSALRCQLSACLPAYPV